ncbi:MAG: hypothetical protein IJU68_04675 [Bacteroidales bacterium]|nr:hypothetical protein [Bacteroidales bacterium]
MQRRLLFITFLALQAATVFPAAAQEAGIFNSIKGFGAYFSLAEKNGVFHSATAFVDIYGVATSRCSFPGYKFNVSRQYIIREFDKSPVHMRLYAGPGISLGMVHDHDKGRGIDFTSLISDNTGFMLAVSGDIGCRFDFGSRVALDLSFMAEGGFHLREYEKEKSYSAASLSFYNNGILQDIYPQLTILFRL